MEITLPLAPNSNLTATISIPDTLRVVEEVPPKAHAFRVMTQKDGDKRIVWDSQSIPEIHAAKQLFNDLISQGLVPHRCDPSGKTTPKVMDRFDPSAEEVVFLPPIKQFVAGG